MSLVIEKVGSGVAIFSTVGRLGEACERQTQFCVDHRNK